MKFGNREKIVIGSIASIVTVGALHMLLFKNRADSLIAEKTEYETKKGQIEALGAAKDPLQIAVFQYGNQSYLTEFYETIKTLNLAQPDYYSVKFDIEKQKKDLEQELTELLKLRVADQKPKLTFLEESGWSLPEKLPDEVTATGGDLGDKVRGVLDADEVIKVLPQGAPLRQQKEFEYKGLMRGLGVDPDKADQLAQQGDLVRTFYVLHRSNLILSALAKDFSLKTPLPDLLRLRWPESNLISLKQIQALIDILKIARASEVEEVVSVKLEPVHFIYPEDAIAGIAQAAPAGPVGGVMPSRGMEGEDGMPPRPAPRMEDEGLGPGGPGMADGVYGGAPPAARAAAPPSAKILGSAAPIRMEIIGPNLNVMKFLYQLSYAKRPYDVDYIAIKSVTEPAGSVRAILNVNVVTSAGTRPPITPEMADAELKKAQQRKTELLKMKALEALVNSAAKAKAPGAPAPAPAPAAPK